MHNPSSLFVHPLSLPSQFRFKLSLLYSFQTSLIRTQVKQAYLIHNIRPENCQNWMCLVLKRTWIVKCDQEDKCGWAGWNQRHREREDILCFANLYGSYQLRLFYYYLISVAAYVVKWERLGTKGPLNIDPAPGNQIFYYFLRFTIRWPSSNLRNS